MSVATRVRHATADEVLGVLTAAFAGYPVLRHILGETESDPEQRRMLIRLFVMNRELRGDPILLAEQDGAARAAMTLTRPDSPAECVAADDLADETWARLGEDALARYRQFADAANSVDPGVPNLHVNMVGVLPDARGLGLARFLLEEAQRRSLRDPGSTGVSLTTENPANVPLYEHLGYRVIGHRQITGTFATWGFFRPNDPMAAPPTQLGSRRF
jgi:GNAT superfamily N-acetyltransferase